MRQFITYILFISSLSFSQNIVLELDTNLLRIGERFNIIVKSKFGFVNQNLTTILLYNVYSEF